MARITLKNETPFATHMEVGFYDAENPAARKRGTVDIEFSKYDIQELKDQGLDLDGAVKYYEEWLFNTLRRYLLSDPEYAGGYEEVMEIVREKISRYYE